MKAGLVLLIAVITGMVTLLYESVKVTNGVEGYAFVVFLICITIWGLFKYRSEIFEVASAGMIQGQQLAERMAYSTVGSFGEAGEKGISGVKRMTKGAYKAGGMVRGFINQQGEQQEESSSPPSSTGRGRSQISSPKSSKRNLTGRDPKKNGSVANQNGKTGENKIASVVTGAETIRSASRNAGAAIVSLHDYKNEKGEETAKGVATNQSSRDLGRTVSKARKSSPKPGSKSQEGSNREVLKPSEQPARGTVDHGTQRSTHRNPAARVESQKEVAATRESGGHLTQWEVQQKLDARKVNVPSESKKLSENRKLKS
ncbi:MAG: hypothetical protein ACJ8MO_24615, partial [Bacillus sp. (in: firmicutes)]